MSGAGPRLGAGGHHESLDQFVSFRIQRRPMYTFLRSVEFDHWLSELKDLRGKARILERLRSATLGNFGDCEPVGEGVSEMRIHVGPGYRVYFARSGQTVYLLLCGGSKASQKRDIARAKRMAREIKESRH